MADPESVDYVSDSSENNSQLNFSLSQQYLSTLSFDEDDNDQSLTSPIRQPTGPSPSLSQLSSLPLSQVLFHDFSSYQFLKPFKKYIPKLLRFHKIQNYLQNSLHGIDQRTTRMTGNHFSINQKVTVNLPRLREEEGIILQVRKSSSSPLASFPIFLIPSTGNCYYLQVRDKKYVLPGCLLIAHSSSPRTIQQATVSSSVPVIASVQNLNSSSPISSLDYHIGDLVFVERRCWPGMNKEGGVGKVTSRNEPLRSSVNPNDQMNTTTDDEDDLDDFHPTYDVTYVLGGKEQNIPAKYLSLKRFEEVHHKPRSTLGRCRSVTHSLTN
jgi:hypothetical protein